MVANLFNGVDGSEVRANVAAFAAGGWLYITSLPHFFEHVLLFQIFRASLTLHFVDLKRGAWRKLRRC